MEETGPAERASGAVTYWGVPEVDAAYARLLALGAKEHEAVHDVGDDIRLGSVLDPFGNIVGIIFNPHFVAEGREAPQSE